MRDEGLLTPAANPEDEAIEAGLRPRRMEDFIGQAALKERLAILIEAARGRGEAVDHVLFSGPPGLGKTSLGAILAAAMGAQFRGTSGPALERPGDLAAVITNLEAGDVLFIDEIHRLPRQVEEVLYPAMEDFQLDIVVGKGPAARSIKIDLPPFTLIGATTRVGRVAPPLRDRFGYLARIDYYGAEDLGAIVNRSAAILEVDITTAGAETIAGRSRGTPRVANRLLRRVRDYAAVRADGRVDEVVADQALEVFEVPGILGLPSGIYVFSTKIYAILHTVSEEPVYGQANALAIVYVFIAIIATWRGSRFRRRRFRGWRTRRFERRLTSVFASCGCRMNPVDRPGAMARRFPPATPKHR